MTSTDGISDWTLRTIPTGAQTKEWRSVCYSEELMLLVAVCDVGTANNVIISTDGITWVEKATPYNNAWWDVKFIPYDEPTDGQRIIEPVNVSITNEVSKVVNWDFSSWSGGTVDVAPDGWTKVTNGQSASTASSSGNYSYKITGNSTDAVRGKITQATTLAVGWYTLGAWVHIDGATQGTLKLDVGSYNSLYATSANNTANTWGFADDRFYVSTPNPDISIYVEGTPNTGSKWYVESIILYPDATAISGVETDNGVSVVQEFSYTPTGVHTNAVFQTMFYGIDVVNNDGSQVYPVTDVVI
jgi:hypothetical protein